MWLDELADLVRALRDRTEKHGTSLGKNETRTRYALIDPLLKALGWDVSDPGTVTPEFEAGDGKSDYALLDLDGKPVVFLEAKRLGTKLKDQVGQVITYCNERGVKYCVVTNGMEWAAYDVFKAVPNTDKLITKFALSMPEHEAAVKMLWLWRRNLISGSPTVPAELLGVTRPSATADGGDSPGNAGLASGETVKLDQFRSKHFDPPPKLIRYPDGTTAGTERWFQLQTSSVEWMVRTRRLRAEDCPVTTPRGTHVVHTSPTRMDGSKFVQPKQAAGLWVDSAYDAPDHVRMARTMLAARGVDPGTVEIELREKARRTKK